MTDYAVGSLPYELQKLEISDDKESGCLKNGIPGKARAQHGRIRPESRTSHVVF